MKNVRLVDIAEKLNITKVSVSKALRNHPDISEGTKVKVKEMANKLGYRPNLVARSLTSSKSKTIGVIIPKIAHFFFASVMEGIYRAAKSNGYEIFLGVSFEDEEQEKKLLETMMEMRVDGLLISVTEETKDPERFKELQKMGINLVFFDRGIKDAGFSYVKAGDRESAKLGVKKLIEKGYTDIAHIAGYDYVEIGKDRKRGYMDAMEEAGLEINQKGIVEGGFSEDDGYKGFETLLENYGVPKALFTVTYPVGLGVLKSMKEHNIDPKEVQFLSFGKSDFNNYLSSPFLCIDQPTFHLGEKAMGQLLNEINSENSSEPKLIELPSLIPE
ncbi:LacI family transcriptional regulator [Rhodohalobacter sp. SW132]|uniref:LacI family DNA-binding transcriptional regulator n=1 Tax=Rhodohalobacter sp. SW132 TaxID=2293433 RepID=UPI000E26F031|nr:LacI family DNA-binding transcriptional regulator [Rhodohalobacter sp. SW132]REL33175.1 LacI family transcriptional regulator [Rhodohalobacter sp. SW132]